MLPGVATRLVGILYKKIVMSIILGGKKTNNGVHMVGVINGTLVGQI